MKVRRIGVLTSGGDAPGMNACVRAVVRTAIHHGFEVYGIRRGWHGLIHGDVTRLQIRDVSRIINRGGTILYTARSKEFMTEEGQRKAASTCKFLGLDSVIAIGGDGTFRGAQALSKFGINVIGIPATIDNDIGCTNYCLGFDTAANTAIECIDKLRDTMQSHERCSVVEVMGRHAGFLAMYVGLAVGATAVLVPENPISNEELVETIRRARLGGFSHYMVVVAEGAGAVSVAAAMFNKVPVAGKKVVCLVSGGNIDVTILSRVIDRGLLKSGRTLSIQVNLVDKPGQLQGVANCIADAGGNVTYINHEKATEDMSITDAYLRITMETKNFEHIDEILTALSDAGFTYQQF